MNDQFAQLAMMQPQGPAPTPPPSAGPVGGRLAQLWEAFKTDPNMRQAVLHAGAAMSQSPPAGQNAFGMIGAGIERGALTFDALKERQRAQGIDDERFSEQIGLKRQGVNLQERSLDEQVKTRGEDREFRSEELRRDRKFRSLLTMNAQEFHRTESALNRKLQQEIAGMQHSGEGRQATHPTVHLAEAFGSRIYQSDPTPYDRKAAEFNAADGGSRTGVDLAIAEQVRIQNETARFVKENPNFYDHKAFEARLGLEGDLAADPIKIAILQEIFKDNPQQLGQILDALLPQTPALRGAGAPAMAPRGSDTFRAPAPPTYVQRLEPGATPAMGDKGRDLEARVARGEGRTYPETGEAIFLRGSQRTGFWVEDRQGTRFEIPEGFDNFPPLER